MTERWVCRRCFADNQATDAACTRCGLTRGADASAEEQQAWAAQTGRTMETEPPAWRRLLRFWWIPALLIFLAVGWFTQARRDDDGSLSTSGSVSVYDLRPGDCFNEASEETEISDVDGVPCDEPHAYEVYAVADYESDTYPASDAQFETAFFEVCVPPFADYVGVPYEDSALWASAITPTESGWNDGDREFICYLHEEDESMLNESQRDAGR